MFKKLIVMFKKLTTIDKIYYAMSITWIIGYFFTRDISFWDAFFGYSICELVHRLYKLMDTVDSSLVQTTPIEPKVLPVSDTNFETK